MCGSRCSERLARENPAVCPGKVEDRREGAAGRSVLTVFVWRADVF